MTRFSLVLLALASVAALAQNNISIIIKWNLQENLMRNLEYIDKNSGKCNADCLLGLQFALVFMEDLQRKQNKTSEGPMIISRKILRSIDKITWKIPEENLVHRLLNRKIWQKPHINFNKTLSPKKLNKTKIFHKKKLEPSTDFCLDNFAKDNCFIHRKCAETYLRKPIGSGYILTHQLLMLQIFGKMKKNCPLKLKTVKLRADEVCAEIFQEVTSLDFSMGLGDALDLFLEQTVLCGYEGYKDFLSRDWLKFIMAAQKTSGCFPGYLKKSRVKRNINFYGDGCADHTTGLGTAVLALYYNFLESGI